MVNNGFAAVAEKKFKSLPDLSSQPCIYKAPDHLRVVNKECYKPYVISIGPLHYRCPSLKPMQDCKFRCLKFFLEHDENRYRSGSEHYMRIIKELEGEIRDCYAESTSLVSDVFNKMILVDSAFIICLFMESHSTLSSSPFLSDMRKRNLLKWEFKLKRDLFLEENQIHFFVLERLYQEAFGAAHSDSFLDLACSFILGGKIPVIRGQAYAATTIQRIKTGPKILHLVDLLRSFCLPTLGDVARGPNSSTSVLFPSSASDLEAAGVKFAPSTSSNLLDIKFSKGVLEIPPFEIWDVSESYFRSLILFEQSHLPISDDSYLHHYMVLLKKLIRGPKDVQILVKNGIIDNWIGSEERVARIFNGGLTKHIPLLVNFYYFNVCQNLNAYANTRWNLWKAILKRDYFSHPWAILSVIYALLLLVLATLQTIDFER